jgi:hypothetical protein
MVVLTNVSLQFNGVDEYLENAVRQVQGVANLWTITIWMKPFETTSIFDSEGRQLFRPDGKTLLHIKGTTHHNEILIWGDRIEDSITDEFIVVENWDNTNKRIRVTRFNLAQKRQEWRNFSCAWNGDNLIAWNNGIELTDLSETLSGTGSFIMEDPTASGRWRSVRIAAAYSGIATNLDAPRLITYSGLLGPIGVWGEVLEPLELNAISSGTFAYDLSTNSGTYTSSANLQHWWRLGGDAAAIGADYAGIVDVGVDATVTGTNIVVDSV